MKPQTDKFSFYALLNRFLNRYLPLQRASSSHTIDSYRQTMQLLRDYFRDQKRIAPDDITFSLLTKENIQGFLRWLLDIRNNSESTANQRLAAIKSFLAFAELRILD